MIAIVLVNTVVMAGNHFGSCVFFFLCFLVCTHLSTFVYASEDPTVTWGYYPWLCSTVCLVFVCFEVRALFRSSCLIKKQIAGEMAQSNMRT